VPTTEKQLEFCLCSTLEKSKHFKQLNVGEKKWLQLLILYYWYLLGNKCDMENRKVTFEQAKSYAEMNNMKYFEISALTGEYVNEVFRQLAVDLLMMQDLSAPVKNQTIVKEANKETITFLNVFESMKKKVASIVEDKPKNSNISRASSQVQSESSSKVKIKSFFDDVKKAVGQIKLPKYLDDSDNDNKKTCKRDYLQRGSKYCR